MGGRAEFIIAVVWKCVIGMTDIIYINEARKPGKINGFDNLILCKERIICRKSVSS